MQSQTDGETSGRSLIHYHYKQKICKELMHEAVQRGRQWCSDISSASCCECLMKITIIERMYMRKEVMM